MSIEENISKDENGRLVRTMYERTATTTTLMFGSEIKECYVKAVAEERIKDDIFRQIASHHYKTSNCRDCSGFEKRNCYIE